MAIPDLHELVELGWKAVDIARKYGLDHRQVWWRIRREELPYKQKHRGHHNPAWRGGRIRVKNYVYVWFPEHPFATKHGYVLESRLVMECLLGRYLTRKEVVHHKQGFANTPDNLVLYGSNGEHLAHTLKGQAPQWTPEGYARILEGIRRSVDRRKAASLAKSKTHADV